MPEQTVLINEDGEYDATPTYLFDYADLYKTDPKEAGLTWFANARYGLSISYGLHSLIGQGIDILPKLHIPLESYENLKDNFKAEHFDAVDIVEFAIANGMRYIDFTARGLDGFCLYNSQVSNFNSATSPAKRDLLAELASVCEYQGIGLCITYSYSLDYRHPHSPNSLAKTESPSLDLYLEYTEAQLKELLTQFGPVAAICLEDLPTACAIGSEQLDINNIYKMIHGLQPQTLVSFQQGFTGEEDFFTVMNQRPDENSPMMERGFITSQLNKPLQIRSSITPNTWSYAPEQAGKHLKETAVLQNLKTAHSQQANFLLNTSLLPDGSLDLEDINTLLAVGRKIQSKGF